MYLLHFFNVLFTIIVSLHSASTAASTFSHPGNIVKQVQAFQNIIIPSPTNIPSITPNIHPAPKAQSTIDCAGPDGKHLQITQKACDDFTHAWNIPSKPSVNPWGVAQQIGEHTYTIKVGHDDRMATASEIFSALNNYRHRNGKSNLLWDEKLSAYAASRANMFARNGALDQHAGFKDYLHNQDGFNKLGFNHIGENASLAGPLFGVHIIEWVFAADSEHNNNQLRAEWSNIGVGVSGIATDVIFASEKR